MLVMFPPPNGAPGIRCSSIELKKDVQICSEAKTKELVPKGTPHNVMAKGRSLFLTFRSRTTSMLLTRYSKNVAVSTLLTL
jgi:hypothetical protein